MKKKKGGRLKQTEVKCPSPSPVNFFSVVLVHTLHLDVCGAGSLKGSGSNIFPLGSFSCLFPELGKIAINFYQQRRKENLNTFKAISIFGAATACKAVLSHSNVILFLSHNEKHQLPLKMPLSSSKVSFGERITSWDRILLPQDSYFWVVSQCLPLPTIPV